MKYINFGLLYFIFFSLIGCSGEYETISINTPTIQCGMCQKTIEMGLKKTEGVNKSIVDLETKTTKVIYNKDKIDLEKIEKVISDLGYQANNELANPSSYENLPACCKIGGMDHL